MRTKLLAEVASPSLDDWLRNRFFDEHCKLFHHRPFVWHIWDGRKRDGFHALVNYHKLAEKWQQGSPASGIPYLQLPWRLDRPTAGRRETR